MGLYLGGEKFAGVITRIVNSSTDSTNSLSGFTQSDENGIITFPELNFTPKLIAVWNINRRDLKAEAEAGEDWDESLVRFVYEGFMVFAIKSQGVWISQGLTQNSGEVYISNASYSFGSCVSVQDNIYSYRLGRDNETSSSFFANADFNYIIYG